MLNTFKIITFTDPHTTNLPVIERIYPKASELSEILNYNPCPECAEVFHNTPNLEMHLVKCHGRETSRITTPHNVIKQFYCPEAGCKYSGCMMKEFGSKFFTQHKYLKQVILPSYNFNIFTNTILTKNQIISHRHTY